MRGKQILKTLVTASAKLTQNNTPHTRSFCGLPDEYRSDMDPGNLIFKDLMRDKRYHEAQREKKRLAFFGTLGALGLGGLALSKKTTRQKPPEENKEAPVQQLSLKPK